MRNIRFDWRWVIAIVVLLALTNTTRIPWPVTVLVVGGGGGWLLAQGWRVWARGGTPISRNRVTYWRGQRIELEPQRRGPALPRMSDIGPAAIYLLLGGVLVLAALAIALRNLGI